MAEPVKLVTRREKVADDIQAKFEEFAEMAKARNWCGMAVVTVAADGHAFVSTLGTGNRVLLLGAVADLQYTLAKDGDKS